MISPASLPDVFQAGSLFKCSLFPADSFGLGVGLCSPLLGALGSLALCSAPCRVETSVADQTPFTQRFYTV